MSRETRISMTELEQVGEYDKPETSAPICSRCDAPVIDGECEC